MKKRYVILLTAICVVLIGVISTSDYLFVALLARDGKVNLFVPSLQVEVSTSQQYSNEVSIVLDNLNLYGYTMEQDTNEWIIVVHGYNTSGKQMYWASSEFYKRGYNVLAIDLRGHGQSEGDYIGLGSLDQYDVCAWISFLEEYDKDCKIGLYGVSMGASAIMNAASNGLSDRVLVVMEDSGFSKPWDVFEYHMKETFTIPTFPFLNITNLLVNYKLGYSLKLGPIDIIENNTIPTLFIHGTNDFLIPMQMVNDLYDLATCTKELYLIEGAGHVEANEVDSHYWDNLVEFMKKNGL